MSVPGPVLGPCTPWIDGVDVAQCFPGVDCESPSDFDLVALEASATLFEISGRRFPGDCERTVRPCADRCRCWGLSPSLGISPWYWTISGYGVAPTGWYWRNECGDTCGCGSLSYVRLPGYPVREITRVTIDGDELDYLDENGNPNWRLDGYRKLVRMDDPGPPVAQRRWPGCQNLALDESQPGTFSVSYTWGEQVPDIGRAAASQLAQELFKACGGAGCEVPPNTVKIQRQGVTIDRNLLLAWLDPTKPTGLVSLDLFLQAYWPRRKGRRPVVYSPDVQQFARQVGSP